MANQRPCDQSRKVLVVDDNADTADTLTMILRALGHDARTAYSGPSALEVAESFQPDTVLLDLGLPKLDGYEVARRLRAQSQLRETQLIAITGFGQTGDFERSREAGFDAHFIKPVDPVVIQELLTKVMPSLGL